jgi:hypothetical protein
MSSSSRSKNSTNGDTDTTFLPYGENSRASGSKFAVDCQDLISADSPTTAGWLDSVKGLQLIDQHKALGVGHKKILEAIFHRRRKVVVKIADAVEDLSTEWKAYAALHRANVARANIVSYLCYFRCADSLPRVLNATIDPHNANLCQGVDDSMQVLVMEHVDGRSMKRFDWATVPVEALRGCLYQVVRAMLDAHVACGFSHGDLHLDNVIVRPTTRTHLKYTCAASETVETCGMLVKLMDLPVVRERRVAQADAVGRGKPRPAEHHEVRG